MKFIASTGTLLKHLQAVQGVISSNSLLPILENFLFELQEDSLKISTTDLHTSMTTVLSVRGVDKTGVIAVPAKILIETLKSMPEQPVTFNINDTNAIEIKSDNGIYRLQGEIGSDFPKIQTMDVDAGTFLIPAKALLNAITTTFFAVSTDELRLAMTGVNFDMKKESVAFVATDAHKLVRHTLTMDLPMEGSIIVPRKALNLLKSALPDNDSMVKVAFNTSNIFFDIQAKGGKNDSEESLPQSTSLTCRLIDQKYPDYNAVIPTENPNKMRLNRYDFLGALKRTSIYSNKATNQIRMSIKGSELTIAAEDMDYANSASEKLICEFDGEDMEIGFNARFLIEMLNTLSTEEVLFELSTPSRPGLLFPGDKQENEDTLMLIMPVMLNKYD